jgi:hypothetical protein
VRSLQESAVEGREVRTEIAGRERGGSAIKRPDVQGLY